MVTAEITSTVAVAEIVENTAVFIFPYKGLGYPDAVNAFCDIGIQVGLLVALDLPGAVLFFLNKTGKNSQNREAAHTHQGQLNIDGKHEKDDEYKAAQVRYGIEKTIGKQVAQVIDIVYYPYLDFSMGFVIIVGERKLLQMAENIGPQLVDDGLANPVGDFDFGFQGDD